MKEQCMKKELTHATIIRKTEGKTVDEQEKLLKKWGKDHSMNEAMMIRSISADIKAVGDELSDFLKSKSVDSFYIEPACKTFVYYWFKTAQRYDMVFLINDQEQMINNYLSDLRAVGAKEVELLDLIRFAIKVQGAALTYLRSTGK